MDTRKYIPRTIYSPEWRYTKIHITWTHSRLRSWWHRHRRVFCKFNILGHRKVLHKVPTNFHRRFSLSKIRKKAKIVYQLKKGLISLLLLVILSKSWEWDPVRHSEAVHFWNSSLWIGVWSCRGFQSYGLQA